MRALFVKSMLAVGPSLGGSVPRTQMRAFVKVRQELRADGAAKNKIDRQSETRPLKCQP